MMNQTTANQAKWQTELDNRVVTALRKKLQTQYVDLLCWRRHRTGAMMPVFIVPADLVSKADECGFDAWQFVTR